MDGATRNDVMLRLKELIAATSFDLFRPVVFLLSRPDTSAATDYEVLEAMAASGKRAAEVLQVPTYA